MLYHIARNGQNYGPYTAEDLKRYVASGNVLLTDMARSEDMAAWVSVAQVLGIAMPAPPPNDFYPRAAAYPVANLAAYPDAPNLSWGLVLLFSFFTCTVFMWVWNLVLSAWMQRVQPNGKAFFFYVAATVLLVSQIFLVPHTGFSVYEPGSKWWTTAYVGHPLRGALGLIIWIVRLVARFTMRAELEHHFNGPEPVGLSLSGVMTFFFGGLYFQYHLNRINEIKRLARYRGAIL